MSQHIRYLHAIYSIFILHRVGEGSERERFVRQEDVSDCDRDGAEAEGRPGEVSSGAEPAERGSECSPGPAAPSPSPAAEQRDDDRAQPREELCVRQHPCTPKHIK